MKNLLVLLILSCVVFNAYAQRHKQAKTKFGITINPAATWITPDSRGVTSQGSKMGIYGGLAVENYFSKNYAFSTGITIGNFGGQLRYADTIILVTKNEDIKVSPETDVNYKLQFISVPIGLKLKTNPIGYFTYYAHLGFMAQLNIKSKVATTSFDGEEINNENISREVNPGTASYFFGGGVEYDIGGNAAITAGVVYNNSFIDILKNKDSSHNSKDNLNFFTVHLGVMF